MTLKTDPDTGMEEDERKQMNENEGKKREVKEFVQKEDNTREGMKEEESLSEGKAAERKKRKSTRKVVKELSTTDSVDVPMVTLEHPTPSPHPPTRIPDENNNDEVQEADDDEEESEDDGEEEEVEEEEVDTDMTLEEKQAMYDAVKSGDIDVLEDCLDKPNADINMIWYKENLLMASIRHEQQEMAEFLLDNGVDHSYSTSVVSLRDTPKGKMFDRYDLTCRQMAYDQGLFDIVQLIDLLQGKLWPFIRPPDRTPRYRRPKPPTPTESEDSSSDSDGADDSESSGSESDTEGSESDAEMAVSRRKKKRKGKAEDGMDVGDGGGKEKVDDTGVTGSIPDAESVHHGEQSEGESVTKRDRKKHKKKKKKHKWLKKKEHADDADGDTHGGEEDEKDKTGTGSGFDVDSGHHSLASSKLKIAMLREHDKLSEKEEKSLSSEGGLFPPQARHEDRSVQDLALTPRTEKSEAEGSHVNDEGYGSISLKSATPCVSPDVKPTWAAEPSNRIKSTKAALALMKSNHSRQQFMSEYQAYVRDRPLRWRKVSTVGSYAKESRQWHVKNNNIDEDDDETSVEISEIKLSLPSSSQSSTRSSSTSSSALPKCILKSSTGTSSPMSSISEKSPSPLPANKSPQPKISTKADDKVAGYMRQTKSTMTKKRLSPNFVTSYGALDFQYKPSAKRGPGFATATVFTSGSRSLTPSSMSVTSSGAGSSHPTKLQKRNHNAISFRS